MIDQRVIDQAALRAGGAALNRGGLKIASRAKELAPVRKVFEGQDKRYRVRLKSISEVEADRDIRRQLGLGPERTHIRPPTTVVVRAPQLLGQRAIRQPGELQIPSAQERLDARGRYELRTMRAAHNGQLGGHLRDRIHSTEPVYEGKTVKVRVVSPAPYSKYQEFGSSHNPAHPFMRPAAHENVSAIKADVASSVAAAVAPLFRVRMDVVIPTRLRGAI